MNDATRERDGSVIAASRLREIPIFADLDEAQLGWLGGHTRFVRLSAGEALFHEGDPAELMFAVIEGEIRGKAEKGKPDGRLYVLTPGKVSGMLPHSRMTHFPITTRAGVPTLVACFSTDFLPEMLSRIPVLESRLASVMADRVRDTTEQDQLRERLMGLGKLSAGLAHELNNPTAAIQRSVDELRARVESLSELTQSLLEQLAGSAPIQEFVELKGEKAPPAEHVDALDRSGAEERLADWLDERGVPEPWLAAETFVAAGIMPEQLSVADRLPETVQPAALRWLEGHLASLRLVQDTAEAAGRVSRLVAAVKSYSHMDRAQTKSEVDVVEGLETTFTVLGHKLREKGVSIIRDYAPDLPRIFGNVGELNQVWTNLIDNAADASPAGGSVTIRTTSNPVEVTVQIIDAGDGIPPEVRQRIFEPFFTTKGVGVGTGLGLDIVQRIVTAHHGAVRVDSVPGQTCFEVQLPVRPPG